MKRVAVAALVLAVALAACSTSSSPPPDRPGVDVGRDGSRPSLDASLDASKPRDAGRARDARAAMDAARQGDAGGSSAPDAAALPSLRSLRVAAASDAAVTLTPPFSPAVFDYYVRCAPGSNPLVVSMVASPGAESALREPTASPSLPAQTLSVAVDEGQAVVAVATEGTAAAEYWVRCLPADFPALAWTPHADAGARTPGYYLIGTTIVPPRSGAYAMALDENGVPVWYSSHGNAVYDVESVVAGAISYASPFELHVLSPIATVPITVDGGAPDPHELRALPDGNYVVFSGGEQRGVDLTGLSVPGPDGGVVAFGPDSTIACCDILEVDPQGQVLWRWVATDHFDPVDDMTYVSSSELGGDGSLDAFHCNSIDVDPANGNLLVSSRNMDSVFYVERASGRVVWKMGGAEVTRDGAAYVAVDDPFFRQHDARLLPGWTSGCGADGGRAGGQVSLFDDETDEPGPARGVVYDVRFTESCAAPSGGGDGGAGGRSPGPGHATVAWQYGGAATAGSTGSFRVLPDGSRTIGWGQSVPPVGVVFSEVDEQGDDLLDLLSPDGLVSYRAVKVPRTALGLDALRGAAGH